MGVEVDVGVSVNVAVGVSVSVAVEEAADSTVNVVVGVAVGVSVNVAEGNSVGSTTGVDVGNLLLISMGITTIRIKTKAITIKAITRENHVKICGFALGFGDSIGFAFFLLFHPKNRSAPFQTDLDCDEKVIGYIWGMLI